MVEIQKVGLQQNSGTSAVGSRYNMMIFSTWGWWKLVVFHKYILKGFPVVKGMFDQNQMWAIDILKRQPKLTQPRIYTILVLHKQEVIVN